eukprot:jgi/Tetstr1/464615/TSEL_009369.t1
MPPDSLQRPGLFPIALGRVLEYIFGNPRLQPAADENYHAACYGAFIAGSAVELRKLLAACVTDGIRVSGLSEAIVHSMEAIDEGHRFRLTHLRKYWDTQMYHGDTFALDVPRQLQNYAPGAPRATFAKAVIKDYAASRAQSDEPVAHAALSTESAAAMPCPSGISLVLHLALLSPPGEHHLQTRQRRTERSGASATKTYTTKFIADAEAKAPLRELMRGSIEALYGTDGRGAKVLCSTC